MGFRVEWMTRVYAVDFSGKSQEGEDVSRMLGVEEAKTDGFGDNDFELAEQHLSKFSYLSTVQFVNTRISDKTLGRLAKFPKLEMVNLRKCPNLSDAGIADFTATRPEITTIASATRLPRIQETNAENQQ